jgi:hypothetical protein
MITCEEIAVRADQDFYAFLREWAAPGAIPGGGAVGVGPRARTRQRPGYCDLSSTKRAFPLWRRLMNGFNLRSMRSSRFPACKSSRALKARRVRGA